MNLVKYFFTIFIANNLSGQLENNNSSLKFPNDINEKSIPLYKQPKESQYLQKDFLKKAPIDMTDPNLDQGENIIMENPEKFLDPGDYYLSKLNGKS